jgi:hypothetical protein
MEDREVKHLNQKRHNFMKETIIIALQLIMKSSCI